MNHAEIEHVMVKLNMIMLKLAWSSRIVCPHKLIRFIVIHICYVCVTHADGNGSI